MDNARSAESVVVGQNMVSMKSHVAPAISDKLGFIVVSPFRGLDLLEFKSFGDLLGLGVP